MSKRAGDADRADSSLGTRLVAMNRSRQAAQAMSRVMVSAVRHGLAPAGLATAQTLRAEGISELHWKALGDGLVRFLGNSGPVFTKFGQILATRSDLLPPTVCARLEALYSRQAPMSRRHLERCLQRAYGGESPFEEFVDEPMAVGSVGQVHRARLRDGTRVVVKIIGPSVEGRIASDLQLARVLLNLFLDVAKRDRSASRTLLTRVIDDLAEGYAREVDLQFEAEALEDFKRRFAANPNVAVPSCYGDLSSQRVLVMEELVGEPLSAFRARAKTDPEAARRVANLALSEILRQIFEEGRFHADPHAGNLLVLEDGRLGVIDLGLTGELSREDRRRIARAVKAFLARDADALILALLGFGIAPPEFDPHRFKQDVAAVVQSRGGSVASRLKGGKSATAADEASNALETFVTELFGVAHAHGIHVPSSATLLIKTLVTIEGVARSLHPELNLATAAAPVILRSLAPRWMKWAFQSRTQ